MTEQRRVLRQEVHLQNTQQHHDGSNERVQKELDRRVETILTTPDSDQEIHRHERHFEEQVEQEQVHRRKDANHGGLQKEQENVVFLLAFLDVVPRRKRSNDSEQRREDESTAQRHRRRPSDSARRLSVSTE